MLEGNTMISVTGFYSESEQAGWDASYDYSYPSPHPGSVFIATCGTMWKPGCWEKVIDMLMFTRRQGLQCWLREVPDPHDADPYQSIARMKDAGVLKGKLSGFDNILLIDCDVMPELDTYLELLKWDIPIVVPYIDSIDDKGVSKGVSVGRPEYERGQGLRPTKWVALSFVLYKNTVFNCKDDFFARATTEMDIFEQLHFYGHRVVMNTDLELKLATPATRPAGMEWEERQEWLKVVDQKRKQTPDRMPLDPSCPYIKDGIYAPYLITSKEERERYYNYLDRKAHPLLIGVNHG